MSPAKINALRRKFIMIAMGSFLLVMLLTGFLVNIAYSHALRHQMQDVLEDLVENEGMMPERHTTDDENSRVLEEYRKGLRYFFVIFDRDDKVLKIDTEHVDFLTEERAESHAREVLDRIFDFGVYRNYYYRVADLSGDRTIAAFVNSTVQLRIRTEVVKYTVLICAAGLFITFGVVFLFSGRAIRSEIENAMRQKEFITNASHELKTPLAVIRANTEIVEMTGGESEWTQSTLRQVEHMNGLIQNLVMIARAQEKEDLSLLEEVDVTKAVRETAEPFTSLAKQGSKTFKWELEEGVTMRIDESAVRQLASILVDNAFKYCDENGTIRIVLTRMKKGRQIVLAVFNSYAAGEAIDYNRYFERFYREDKSHENQKGYGIGLSMAESICSQYGGKIRAEWRNGVIAFICTFDRKKTPKKPE